MRKKNRLYIILFIIVIAFFIYPAFVSADIAVPGMQNEGITYVISNIKNYPDYIFVTNSAIWGGEYATLVDSGGKFGGGGYKLDGYVLVAIPLSSVPANVLAELKKGGGEKASQIVQDYIKNAKGAIQSPESLAKTKLVDEKLPLDSIVVSLNIGNISQKGLSVSEESVTYYYKDGKTEKFNIPANGELPDPTGKVMPATKTPVPTKSGSLSKSGIVKITTIPFGVSVYLDNVLKGKSPITLFTSFGSHQFVLNSGSPPMYVQSFEIKNNTPQIFNINLRDQESVKNNWLFPGVPTISNITNASGTNITKK